MICWRNTVGLLMSRFFFEYDMYVHTYIHTYTHIHAYTGERDKLLFTMEGCSHRGRDQINGPTTNNRNPKAKNTSANSDGPHNRLGRIQ
jgi:hypothetical protein